MDAAELVLRLVATRSHAPPSSGRDADATLVVSIDLGERPVISKHLFGLMLEHLGRGIHGGICKELEELGDVVRTDVVDALRELRTPNLRWPGGCFADGYHWRDGVGPREDRPKRVNQHWGYSIEDNRFGCKEFLELCEAVECEPYIVGNVGSGTIQEMRDWFEYLTHPGGTMLADWRKEHGRSEPHVVRLWGVGNEPWGCGGNMEACTYAAEFRRYACFLSAPPGAPPLTRVACGANGRDTAWTEAMMRLCKKVGGSGRVRFSMEALSVHLYCSVRREGITGQEQGAAAQTAWFQIMQKAFEFGETLRMHVAIMERHDPERLVSLYVDEWGVWYAQPPEGAAPSQALSRGASLLEQTCTLRDALVAALCLHAMIECCERVQLANLAQAVNVLHCPLRTVGDELVRTPTFHALWLLTPHMQCQRLEGQLLHATQFNHGAAAVPRLSAVASIDEHGAKVHVSVVHVHPHAPMSIGLELRGLGASAKLRVERANVLTGESMCADGCTPRDITESVTLASQSQLQLQLPPRSLVVVILGI